MSGNNGGPWGGGGGNRGGGNRGSGGGNRGDGQPQIPEIDEIVKKGQEQLRVLMGGGGGGKNGRGTGGPGFSKRGVLLGLVAVVVMWAFASFYTVRPEERSVELLFG
ncbi:MAG: HflK protein, partial [Roseinatronobacter sp.]